ncbi:MAG: hypothetical protein DRH37_01705 [Deltaproteobacteria bacterium]|nr:MAG: hypothetical protein DRH37_01705 [Deltaproteobacteria bacterium]
MRAKKILKGICLSGAILTLVLSGVQVSHAGPAVSGKAAPSESGLQSEEKPGRKNAKPEKQKKERYEYNPAGKTDPFESFLKSGKGRGGATSLAAGDLELEGAKAIESSREPETELEKLEISKLTLTSIIKGKNKVWAMVIDPKGRGYFLEKGIRIGKHGGVVDEIICRKKKTDFGTEIIRKVIIKVPYRDRNRKIIYRTVEMELPYQSS